jgi:hypothetical protein
MTPYWIGILCFAISNALTSYLGTLIFISKYRNSNKYFVYSMFFIGYCLVLYLITN